jgi:hypothetical protein
MAKNVARRRKSFDDDVDYYDARYEVIKRQVSQSGAGYDPFGATAGKGCASCQWFISPNSCVLVDGDISPSGISKFYTAVEDNSAEGALPVYLVDAPSTSTMAASKEAPPPVLVPTDTPTPVLASVKSAWNWLLSLGSKNKTDVSPFLLIRSKEADEQWRVFLVYSNSFKDSTAEIIPEAAHKEYIDWVDKTKLYPELHLWHGGPGTRWGQVDFIDYVDGFAVSSGLVDKGKEYVAEALEDQSNKGQLKVSHGFYSLKTPDGVHVLYRGFEQSPLPAGTEANAWTGMAFDLFNTKEIDMGFSPTKRAYLQDVLKVDSKAVDAIEKSFADAAQSLKASGVDFKEAGAEPPAAGTTEASVAVDGGIALVVAEFKGIGEAVKSLSDNLGLAITQQDAKHAATQASIAELSGQVKELAAKINKTQDELVTDAYKAAAAKVASTPFSATGSGGYTPTESTKEATQGPGDTDWFGNIVLGGVQQAPMNMPSLNIGASAGAGAGAAPDPSVVAAAAAAAAAVTGNTNGGS